MKKVLYLIAAALVTVVACNKNTPDPTPTPTPDPEPTPTVPDLKMSTPAIVDVEAESSIYTVKFNAGKAWTATLSYPDGSGAGAVLAKEKGDAADGVELKVTFQGLTEEVAGRLIQLDIKAGATTESVLFFQGLVFYPDKEEAPELPVAGGKVDLNILTNMEVSIKKYDGADEAFPWAPVTITEGDHNIKLAFDVKSNSGYDARTAYVKFTLPQIQVPVLDEEGVPTGETTDMVTRFYVNQEGPLQVAWTQQFTWAMYPEGNRESIADAGEYLIINCSKTSQGTGGTLVFKKSDGSFVKTLDVPSCTGVTNDDAGNIIVSAGGNYPIDEATWALIVDDQIPLDVFVYSKSEVISIIENGTSPEKTPIIHYYDGFYGYGLDNIRVTGDATSNAVITMCTSGGYGDFYAIDWDIVNGEVVDNGNGYTAYTALPNFLPDDYSMGIWNSFSIVAKHLGNSSASAMFYMGYDNNYNLHYLSGIGAEWEEVFNTGGAGNEGYNTLATIEWNGHKYLSFISLPYFAWADWDGDGTIDSNLPGYLWLFNIDDPSNPIKESCHEYYCDPTNWQYGDSCDVRLVVEGNDLVAYVVDAASSQYMKIVYPKH